MGGLTWSGIKGKMRSVSIGPRQMEMLRLRVLGGRKKGSGRGVGCVRFPLPETYLVGFQSRSPHLQSKCPFLSTISIQSADWSPA